MRRNIFALAAFGMFLGVCWLAELTVSADEAAKPGSTPQQPLSVSLVRLIANPEAFHGKFVAIAGYVTIEHEGTAVYLHREDAQQALLKNGLWLQVNDVAAAGTREAGVKNRYAMIVGRFNANNQGHLGLWSGMIEQVTRLQAWPSAQN